MVITDYDCCPVCLKVHPGRICLRPPTKEQEKYLQKIQDATGKYDPSVVIGGPQQKHT